MPIVLIVFGNQPFEEIAQIERHVRVRIFLNDQRTGCMLNENGQQPVRYFLLIDPAFYYVRKRIQSLATRPDNNSRMENLHVLAPSSNSDFGICGDWLLLLVSMLTHTFFPRIAIGISLA
jgi:hypothetical protein